MINLRLIRSVQKQKFCWIDSSLAPVTAVEVEACSMAKYRILKTDKFRTYNTDLEALSLQSLGR